MARERGTSCRTRPPSAGRFEGSLPSVVVKFHDEVQLPYEDGVERHLERLNVGASERPSAEFPGVRFRHMYTWVSPEDIREVV